MVALKCSEKILLTPSITHYISFILSSFELIYSLLAWQIQKGTEKELEFLPQISFSSSFLSKGTSSSYSSKKRNQFQERPLLERVPPTHWTYKYTILHTLPTQSQKYIITNPVSIQKHPLLAVIRLLSIISKPVELVHKQL